MTITANRRQFRRRALDLWNRTARRGQMSERAATQRTARSWTARLVGHGLRLSGAVSFRGKGRLVRYWMDRRNTSCVTSRELAGGARVVCDFGVPYEAMVWLRQEEEADLNALRRWLSPGDHFVDCGAGIGLWSLVAAARVGRTGRVTAFEPGAVAYARLCRNLLAAPAIASKAQALNVAVADRAGQLAFMEDAEHNRGRLGRGGTGVTVQAVTIDETCAGERVHGLKLDIEGAEAAALTGAARVIASCRPWVCVEFNVSFATSDRIGDWDVHALMIRLGYRCYRWADRRGRTPGPALGPDERVTGYVNLLFLHN